MFVWVGKGFRAKDAVSYPSSPPCHLHLPSPLFSWHPQTSWSGCGHSCLPVCHLYETAIQHHSPNPILASEELSSNDLILINLNLIAHGSLTEF